ncbi:hypothetical protein [Paraburkholderia atlantica]|uniref:hypothetical protein n=1 Tax=Paraburkholderia atlantica TaxID=2654982 RepID=UPI0003759BCD|nr:hypothetical protein [Paraburkholderia atlantica]
MTIEQFAGQHEPYKVDEPMQIVTYKGHFYGRLADPYMWLGHCLKHAGPRDIWSDAYYSYYRFHHAKSRPSAPRATVITALIEREQHNVLHDFARFTVELDSKGYVRGEAIATGYEPIKIKRLRLDASLNRVELTLAVLEHVAGKTVQSAVDSVMTLMRTPPV